jgi:hypothetical protein
MRVALMMTIVVALMALVVVPLWVLMVHLGFMDPFGEVTVDTTAGPKQTYSFAAFGVFTVALITFILIIAVAFKFDGWLQARR